MLVITFWESEAAIRAFAGDDISVAKYYVGEPLSRERPGDNSEELLLHRGGSYSGSAAKFIREMKGAAISLWAAREPRAHQKQRNIFLCLHRMPSLMRGLE